MAVIRVNKTGDFTVMSNYHFKDKRLSLKAKGLLSQMLSLPDTWDYTVAGLAAINKENETAINSALKELKKYGYLVVTKHMPNETESGRIEYSYDVYEQPHEKQGTEKQGVEILGVEFQGVENQGQLNTNESSTNQSNTKESKKGTRKRFSPPTLEEVREYVKEKGYHFSADEFYAYYASQDWYKSNGRKVSDWKRCCITWEGKEWNKASGKKGGDVGENGVALLPENERDHSLDWIF